MTNALATDALLLILNAYCWKLFTQTLFCTILPTDQLVNVIPQSFYSLITKGYSFSASSVGTVTQRAFGLQKKWCKNPKRFSLGGPTWIFSFYILKKEAI